MTGFVSDVHVQEKTDMDSLNSLFLTELSKGYLSTPHWDVHVDGDGFEQNPPGDYFQSFSLDRSSLRRGMRTDISTSGLSGRPFLKAEQWANAPSFAFSRAWLVRRSPLCNSPIPPLLQREQMCPRQRHSAPRQRSMKGVRRSRPPTIFFRAFPAL